MKRLISSIIALIALTGTASAMGYEQARSEALFLTDKMAYELNLTDAQYDAAFEINLDYLMGVATVDDLYGDYWTRRNLDMEYILLAWQWDLFRAATYFFRPLYWEAGCWHFGIYARYPRRSFFYFGRPSVYFSYRGGHSWRSNGGRSYYKGRSNEFRGSSTIHSGMRDALNNSSSGRRQGTSGSNFNSNRNSNKQTSGSSYRNSGSSYRNTSGATSNRQGGSSYSSRRQGTGSRYDGTGSSTRVTVGNASSGSTSRSRMGNASRSLRGSSIASSLRGGSIKTSGVRSNTTFRSVGSSNISGKASKISSGKSGGSKVSGKSGGSSRGGSHSGGSKGGK